MFSLSIYFMPFFDWESSMLGIFDVFRALSSYVKMAINALWRELCAHSQDVFMAFVKRFANYAGICTSQLVQNIAENECAILADFW